MNKIAHLLLIVLLMSCTDNSPSFLEPQPADSKNLQVFPNKLIGDYLSDDDGEKLSISKYLITQWGSENIEFSIAEVDTNPELIIKNDTLYNTEDNDKIPVEIRNDSVFGFVDWKDTVFSLSGKDVLRKIKGYYILNKYSKDSLWKVVRMKYGKSEALEFALINTEKEASEIKKHTQLLNIKSKNDTITSYELNPSKKEFIEMLLSGNLFTDTQKYKKNIRRE